MNGRILLPLVAAAALCGCTMAPRYQRPAAPVPSAWPSAAETGTVAAAQAPAAPDIGWREFIADDRLAQVVGLALTNNRDLRVATLNVERARALYGIQRAELLPKVNANGGGSKQRTPADLSNSGEQMTTERYDANLGLAAWEIDFFGRLRSLKDRALEEYLASEQARRSARLLLVSSVVRAYLTLAADRETLKLAETTLAAQQESHDLIRRRHALGLAPEVDLLRAQTQVDTARRDVARFAQGVALDGNALNLLAGGPVPAALLPAGLDDVAPLPEISAGISSEVLLRRPDLLQAESLLRAAYADIGAARAALFPRISLTAAFGVASRDLSSLFDSGQKTWNFAPQATLPIFDPRAWSGLKVTRVQREIAVTQYEKAIQAAFRETADALAIRDTVGREVSAQQSLVEAVAGTYRLSRLRYDKGIDSYLYVLDAQRSLYAAQQVLVALKLQKSVNRVNLYAVLGGGSGTDAPPAVERPSGR